MEVSKGFGNHEITLFARCLLGGSSAWVFGRTCTPRKTQPLIIRTISPIISMGYRKKTLTISYHGL
jgi:hypothetical protein